MSTRRSRTEIVTTNRAAVLRSARAVFEERGYHGASVDRIAEDAGFSQGVVYSQFGSKVDLFLAVLEASIEARAAGLAEAVDALADRPGPGEVNRLAMAQSQVSLAWQAALLEFRVHAWRHPEVNARYRALHARAIDNVARLVPLVAPGAEIDPQRAAVALMAATTGVTIELLSDPDLDADAALADIGYVSRVNTGELA